jgi:2-polyprenyl-3-methyl-5-hydroxy-6-metoxy-1,4-benzoquinol methylase
VLDAGCGEGLLLDCLALDRFTYTGCDLSPTAIERARKRHNTANLVACSSDAFEPARGEQYDAIVLNEVLATLERPFVRV